MREILDEIVTAHENNEYDFVQKACRKLLRQLADKADAKDVVVQARHFLVEASINLHREGGPLEGILNECNQLFTDYLRMRDKGSAARTLVWKMEFLRDEDWHQACAVASKIIDDFGLSDDEAVMESVDEAFGFLYEQLAIDDPNFVDLCISYGKFLQRFGTPDTASNMIGEIDFALNGVDNVAAITIIENFLAARNTQLSLEDEAEIRSRLASGYLYIGRFEDAVNECNWLLINAKATNSLDYLLWCGEAFLNLGRNKIAAMYFLEVQRELASVPDDERAKSAKALLQQLIPEENLNL